MATVGALTGAELLLVQGAYGITLAVTPGRAFLAMARACKAATGADLLILRWGGYRDKELTNAMAHDPGTYGAQPGIHLLSHPEGTHELGTCVDIAASYSRVSTVGAWLRNGGGARFGFHADTIAGDPNHWKYIAGTATASTAEQTLETPAPAPHYYEEHDMEVHTALGIAGTPSFLFMPGKVRKFADAADYGFFMGCHDGLIAHNGPFNGDNNTALVQLLDYYGITGFDIFDLINLKLGGTLRNGDPKPAKTT